MKAAETTLPAWPMAVTNRPINGRLIFHSDRGVQYACHAFTKLLKKHPLVLQSMSGKGNCWDNAVAESFFKTLKSEMVYQQTFRSRSVAKQAVFEYVEICRAAGAVQSATKAFSAGFPLLNIIVGNSNMLLKDLSSVLLQVQCYQWSKVYVGSLVRFQTDSAQRWIESAVV